MNEGEIILESLTNVKKIFLISKKGKELYLETNDYILKIVIS